MKIIAMITARSTSSRFPRKHLAILDGSPMISHIIENIKCLRGIDDIVLATTMNSEDDDLADLVKQQNCDVVRGSENDLVERHGRVLLDFNPDAVLDISGDCPFMDIKAVQAVIDSVKSHPFYDSYGMSGPYARVPEMLAGVKSASWYLKAFEIYAKHTEFCSADQYWLATIKEPNCMSAYTVDGSAFLNKTVTPMKMSIDWRLELNFWNIVIEHLGYYPTSADDFNKAFKELGDKPFIWSENNGS